MFFLDGVLIALVSIFQILLSLVVSGTFYRYVFRITFFSQLHILAIFVILGVRPKEDGTHPILEPEFSMVMFLLIMFFVSSNNRWALTTSSS